MINKIFYNKKGSLSRNLYANLFQTLVGTIILFFLYRYINQELGTKAFGIWSVVLATVSTSRIFELGISLSVTRFVAMDLAKSNSKEASFTIQTAMITLGILLSILLPIAGFVLNYIFPYIFTDNSLIDALILLPYALLALWFNVIASIFQAGFEGCQRMEYRTIIILSGQLLLLILAIIFIPIYGLVGLAWAQVIQSLFLVISGLILLKKLINELPLFPTYWSWNKLKSMLPYSLNVQLVSVLMMFFDPFTKAFMTRFGGPEFAGYFEIANQIVIKIRSIIISTNQAVVPRITEIIEKEKKNIILFYKNNIKIILLVSIPLFLMAEIWSELIIEILLGYVNSDVLYIFNLTLFAWFINIFNSPAYFSNLGSGKVIFNTISHSITAILNVAIVYLFGNKFGVDAVIFAYVLSLMAGSMFLIISYHNFYKIYFRIKSILKYKFFIIINFLVLLLSNYRASDFLDHIEGSYFYYKFLIPFILSIIIISTFIITLKKNLKNIYSINKTISS